MTKSGRLAGVAVRRAERADGDALIDLILALADFERLPPPDKAAQERLIEHGFGDHPKFEVWLAEVAGEAKPVGYAFLFETYSTFLARPTLYLEDVFVLPEYRGRGIGGALLRHCVGLAADRECGRMEWSCLDWNTGARVIYEKLDADTMSEWVHYRLTRDQIDAIVLRSGQ